MNELVVFSHLRWSFVYQRPQQIVSRLARRFRVLFVEEPVYCYDCMDELTAFKGAPRQLVQRENALMRIANVVFTGGPSLFETRRSRRCNVHLFPSSVDREHFARGADVANTHAEVRTLARPRLGFFGVLDEQRARGSHRHGNRRCLAHRRTRQRARACRSAPRSRRRAARVPRVGRQFVPTDACRCPISGR